MEFKYASWIVLSVGVSVNIFGLFWFVAFVIGLVAFLVGLLTILYLQHGDLDKFLDSGLLENPLEEPKTLGLSIVCEQKPSSMLLISPNIKVQTDASARSKSKGLGHGHGGSSSSSDHGRRRNLLDAGIELLFKNRRSTADRSDSSGGGPADGGTGSVFGSGGGGGLITDHLMHKRHLHFHQRDHTILDSMPAVTSSAAKQPSPTTGGWGPFHNIKIHTDKGRSIQLQQATGKEQGTVAAEKQHHRKKEGSVQLGEEVTASTTNSSSSSHSPLASFKSYITHPESLLHHHHRDSPPGSPRKKKILSGNKAVDKLIHTLVDYVIRDFIDSWYTVVSDSREFSEANIRNSIESLILNVCQRLKSAELLPLMTTKLIDDLAKHTRFYRLASQDVSSNMNPPNANDQKRLKIHEKLSPQKKNQRGIGDGHRRNKSETDLTWHLGNAALQKNVANSKFYGVQADEQSLVDPEVMLLNSFFGFCDEYKKECMDEEAMLQYFHRIAETVLYFTLPEEDFNCQTLRALLCNIFANSILRPMVATLTDPDFINLQIAKHAAREVPAGEFLLKMIRQSNDLSELRACRQLITKEMDAKHKDSNYSAELASLKYTQKLIDLRISHLQNNKSDLGKSEKEKPSSNLPRLSLDDILRKELAVSYYLDYLSVLNLQKYVIFYLTAQEWKITTSQSFSEVQINKSKPSREEVMRVIREKANNLYQEYLTPKSPNYLNIDQGLIEALAIRLRDTIIQPENTWFDSICKYVYEKQKNEEVFLNNFYQSSAYKQLLRELDFSNAQDHDLPSLEHLGVGGMGGILVDNLSDTNSGDLRFDETDDDDGGPPSGIFQSDIKEEHDVKVGPPKATTTSNLLPAAVANVKHARSHSDCTGMFTTINDINIEQLKSSDCSSNDSGNELAQPASSSTVDGAAAASLPPPPIEIHIDCGNHHHNKEDSLTFRQKLAAKIINTAIHCEGQYAVYAIQVCVIEDNQHKSWHIYRRYSKFLELKKLLVKRFPTLAKVPFPAKKAFQNTQRAVLEHRMEVLNLFLNEICAKAESNDDMRGIVRNFLEPDTDDRRMHGGAVVKTIESFKSGMSKIRNMPDTLVGGISRIFLGKGPLKERTFYDIQDIPTLELKQSEYPALASALNLLDEVFDLQNKSQWLRRGLINRLLGAPWVSHATNKKIVQLAGSLLAMDKVEVVLSAVLNNVWPDGDRFNPNPPLREDSTKLRTKLAAKIALFSLLSDDLKHVVGSVTCNTGLLNFFQMLQNKKLNTRLLLILLDHVLRVAFHTDSMTKHAVVGTSSGTGDGDTIRIGTPSGSAAGSRKSSRHYY